MYNLTFALDLQKIFSKPIDSTTCSAGNENIFMKAINLTENTGIFLYYKNFSCMHPFIQIKEWNGDSNLNDFKSFGKIQLNKYDFYPDLNSNDIIKINSTIIYFSSTSKNKEILYIVKFNFYNNFTKFVIRYYIIALNN